MNLNRFFKTLLAAIVMVSGPNSLAYDDLFLSIKGALERKDEETAIKLIHSAKDGTLKNVDPATGMGLLEYACHYLPEGKACKILHLRGVRYLPLDEIAKTPMKNFIREAEVYVDDKNYNTVFNTANIGYFHPETKENYYRAVQEILKVRPQALAPHMLSRALFDQKIDLAQEIFEKEVPATHCLIIVKGDFNDPYGEVCPLDRAIKHGALDLALAMSRQEECKMSDSKFIREHFYSRLVRMMSDPLKADAAIEIFTNVLNKCGKKGDQELAEFFIIKGPSLIEPGDANLLRKLAKLMPEKFVKNRNSKEKRGSENNIFLDFIYSPEMLDALLETGSVAHPLDFGRLYPSDPDHKQVYNKALNSLKATEASFFKLRDLGLDWYRWGNGIPTTEVREVLAEKIRQSPQRISSASELKSLSKGFYLETSEAIGQKFLAEDLPVDSHDIFQISHWFSRSVKDSMLKKFNDNNGQILEKDFWSASWEDIPKDVVEFVLANFREQQKSSIESLFSVESFLSASLDNLPTAALDLVIEDLIAQRLTPAQYMQALGKLVLAKNLEPQFERLLAGSNLKPEDMCQPQLITKDFNRAPECFVDQLVDEIVYYRNYSRDVTPYSGIYKLSKLARHGAKVSANSVKHLVTHFGKIDPDITRRAPRDFGWADLFDSAGEFDPDAELLSTIVNDWQFYVNPQILRNYLKHHPGAAGKALLEIRERRYSYEPNYLEEFRKILEDSDQLDSSVPFTEDMTHSATSHLDGHGSLNTLGQALHKGDLSRAQYLIETHGFTSDQVGALKSGKTLNIYDFSLMFGAHGLAAELASSEKLRPKSSNKKIIHHTSARQDKDKILVSNVFAASILGGETVGFDDLRYILVAAKLEKGFYDRAINAIVEADKKHCSLDIDDLRGGDRTVYGLVSEALREYPAQGALLALRSHIEDKVSGKAVCLGPVADEGKSAKQAPAGH